MNQLATSAQAAVRLPARAIASLFGIGFIPVAPGTWASALGVLTGAWIIMRGNPAGLPEAVLAITVLGLLAVEASGTATADPGWVVIDELAGQWLAMTTLTHLAPTGLALAFVLFRLLDITKLGPVGWADRRHNAAGVMGDDLVAGAIVAGLIGALLMVWPRLLG